MPKSAVLACFHLPFDEESHVDVDTSTMPRRIKKTTDDLFALPCACQNLRRVTRMVTRLYDGELRKAGLEITQFGLLTALGVVGEANQKRLSLGFELDSTTLTRTLALLEKRGWITVRRGTDRRERLFRLTPSGRQQIAAGQPHWERAERKLKRELGRTGWKRMQRTVAEVTHAAAAF